MTSRQDYYENSLSSSLHPPSYIFSISILEDVVFGLWKRAIKANSQNKSDDLRSIPLITFIPCKILEKIIGKELWKVFIPKLDHHQFGSIKGSSTVHYLVDLINYIPSNVDKLLKVTTVTIDLRKAFDLIDNNILINKKFPLGFHDGWVETISPFINFHSQRTRADNKTSDKIDLHCGGLQETVLGPLLFLKICIYVD